MKVGFYITAITDFQDMLPVIAESIRRGQTCWIAVLDCLSQKRQFYYYDKKEVLGSLRGFFVENGLKDPLVKFYGLKEENDFIDIVRHNVQKLNNVKKSIALAALVKACQKKQPRGLFTFKGFRYDDGRLDLKKNIKDQFFDAVNVFNNSIFNNNQKNNF